MHTYNVTGSKVKATFLNGNQHIFHKTYLYKNKINKLFNKTNIVYKNKINM